MPYQGQNAGKGGHSDFVRNKDVQDFLSECEYLREPSDEEGKNIASSFGRAPALDSPQLPEYVIASDASKNDKPINDKLPSTQVGYVKFSHVLIEMNKYAELINPNTRFVSPFKAAEMHRNAESITFTLPGSNVRFQGAKCVKDGFRRAVFKQLNLDRSQGSGSKLVLVETLLSLNSGSVILKACPSCKEKIEFSFTHEKLFEECAGCKEPIFVTDWLRLHEDVSDFGDNASAITRLMNAVEHLLLAGFILQVFHANPRALAKMAFVLDGPLAIFGQPAKLHGRIMQMLSSVNSRLSQLSLEPLLVVGLQKTGEVMDHANILSKFLPNNVLRLLDDEYRYKYIKGNDSPAKNFGDETYYGQDFIFKTEKGGIFTFAVPYPYKDKTDRSIPFAEMKADPAAYGNLIVRACDLIRHFELDLYTSAIVPVALAHRHASISFVPGGKVLDLITRTGLGKK